MTMPSERARALRWAGEFLREVRSSSEVPEQLREQARGILRHYSSSDDIRWYAQHCVAPDAFGKWFSPESKLEL